MSKVLPIMLWIMVFIFGGITFFFLNKKDGGVSDLPPNNPLSIEAKKGAAYGQLPWKHCQNIPPFTLTNQNNEKFDSAELAGRPYVVSFFFAECPGICRDLNTQIKTLRERVGDPEMAFVTISVDPKNDTPEVLNRYAADFDADPKDWVFLTGQLSDIRAVGEQSFRVIVDRDIHTEDILLVDRWGRYRDRFKWNDAYDTKRFLSVAKDVLAETKPPLEETFLSRNMMASAIPSDLSSIKWIREFHLTDQDNQPFFSRDLTGQVWIGNFFFTTCPGICPEQTRYLAALQKRLGDDHPAHIVSISSDPNTDTPAVLSQYANEIGADTDSWTFCTSDKPILIKRIGGEFFKAHSDGGHHSSRLFVVDRFGNVRGDFDWQDPADEVKMLELIDQLNEELVPAVVR